MKINGLRVLIAHTEIDENSSDADKEVLQQAEKVAKAAEELGAKPYVCSYKNSMKRLTAHNSRPDVVFNLVEAVNGTDRDMYRAAMFFQNSYYLYTGSGYKSLRTMADKITMKRMMAEHDILTPMWHRYGEPGSFFHKGEYIIKPLYEHGSYMISEKNVVKLADADGADDKIAEMFPRNPENFFAERYIDGREFNVSVLEINGAPVVLPLAEMIFENWDSGPKIVCEKAKWDEESKQARDTARVFDTVEKHSRLEEKIVSICTRCWDIFQLSGYARVDIRVDKLGEPYVLEINANPSLAPDAGFCAACGAAGYSYSSMVESILKASMRQK